MSRMRRVVKFPRHRKGRLYSVRAQKTEKGEKKKVRYTIRMYDQEYEVLKNQAKAFNVSLQKLFDVLFIDGFLGRDQRVMEFVAEAIEKLYIEECRDELTKFTHFEIQDLIDEIESNKTKGAI